MLNRLATTALAVLLLCGAGTRLPAQEPWPEPADSLTHLDLPPAVAESLIEFVNDPSTLHLSAPLRLPAERVVQGNVAVLGGPVTIGGRVEGRLVVINGDVELLPDAVVAGDLTVVGGELTGLETARVDGEVLVYGERLRYVRQGDRISARRADAGWRRAGGGAGRGGRTDFVIATGRSYNRVEGLPITFGPVIETVGSNPLRIRAMGIYRSESGATLDDLGYYLRAEQFLGGRRAARVGGTLYSVINPIEDWHLTDTENGLATFLLHRDYRDYYGRDGGSVFARLEPRGTALSLGAEARWERHSSEPAGSPWALFGEKRWRNQPLVAEGELHSVALQLDVDSRDRRRDPATGWWLRSEVEHAYHTDLERPAFAVLRPEAGAPAQFDIAPAEPFGRFTAAHVDLRRYNRLGPDSRLNLRLLAGGSLTGDALPPQRQHAFGGEGTLPGYSHFQLDCGARRTAGFRADEVGGAPIVDLGRTDRYYPRYGCDAFSLVQVEYRGRLSLRFDWDGAPWRDGEDYSDWTFGVDASPDWVVFFDAGRGWAYGPGQHEPLAMDLGVGLVLDRLGLYAAVPLQGRGGLNVFLRLGPRF